MRGLVLVISCLLICGVWSYDQHAGLANDYMQSAVLTVSSNTSGSNVNSIRDYNPNSGWQSGACLPQDWVGRQYINFLKGRCATSGACSSPAGTTNIALATDGDVSNSFSVGLSSGVAYIDITLATASTLFRIGLRANNPSSNISIQGFTSGSTTPIAFGVYTKANQYSHQNYKISSTSVIAKIRLTSTAVFQINDVAASTEECFEYLIADMGSLKTVGTIIAKIPTDSTAGIGIYVSSSSPYSWVTVIPQHVADWSSVTYTFPEVTGRYIMYKVPNSVDWRPMQAYEIKAFDKYGLYGAPYAATRANPRNFSELLGVNGIWGWGINQDPNTATTSGPRLFTPVASHARNYHEMGWDLTKPTDVVYYNVSGTPAQWWLDWNVVYQGWHDAGFKVIDASIQFANSGAFQQANWTNPYQNAYTYGFNYARNFGPSRKNLIQVVEVGNEPWSYDADFYVQVLEGMGKGFKDGDSKIRVAPGAFQADTPDYPPNGDGISWNMKYAGFRISSTAVQSLSVINSHCYSYATVSGVVRGVRPEHPTTNFKGFRNMLRWRDVNTPSSELWLTEWGWDGSSSCVDTRCVSLTAQSVYAVRGLLIGAREGIDRLTWFFFGDGGDGSTVYDWSGLVTKPDANKVQTKKPVYYAFVNFLSLLAGYHHVAALREGDDAYIYILANTQGALKLVAWRPVDGDVSSAEQTFTFTINGYSLSGTTFYEIGSVTTGPTTLANNKFSQSGTTFTMILSGVPRVATVVAS